MGRMLRHVLVFLLIILKEPNMLEADCSCIPSLYCRCTGMGLTSIPQNLPTSISDLDLSHNRIDTVNQPMLVRYRENTFASTTMSKSSSFRKTEINLDHTAHPVVSPFATTGGISDILLTFNKPEINRSHKSSPSFSLPALIGSVSGTAALSIVTAVLITIWCKRNSKNPPSGPTSNIALSNINTTATVPTSGNDQTGQGQSLASTQPLNIKHPSHVRRPAVSQTHYYVDADTPNSKTPKGLPPLRDDDEPTYVEPDGAHYMTPEDVLYEMPANSHCEDDNLHYYTH
ncbi:hypothetical protein Bbelb_327550 [Branchiostoma belcheri]|nr:hypothetical protein Bbelb_327550 [Branchiostoma belcheri]